MKVGTGGNFGLRRECHKKLFGPLFYPWWNCPLRMNKLIDIIILLLIRHPSDNARNLTFLHIVLASSPVSGHHLEAQALKNHPWPWDAQIF